MKTYPFFFHKLFCSPLMLLESARFDLETNLLARMDLAPDAEAEFRRPDYKKDLAQMGADQSREYGAAGTPDEHYIGMVKDWNATKQAIRIENIYSTFGNTALINVDGAIDKHMSDFERSCYGGTDLTDVDTALSIAENDPRIERVVMSFNTPGGSVQGVPETAARFKALGETKETRSFVDGLCCSAGYYIASQADQVDGTASSTYGSVGVYSAILDQSRRMEMQGYKVQLIKAGKYKAMGASFKPLEDEERGILQDQCNGLWSDFKGAVSSTRPAIAQESMEGQSFRGSKAKDLGLLDNLFYGSIDDYISSLIA